MPSKPKVDKAIGLVTLVSIGVGSVIGSGIFAMPASMAAAAGPGLILGILIAGIISLFLALPYAELGAAYPIEGGPYSLPRLAMGDLNGFLMGWGYFLYLFIGTAAIINIFVVYLGFYVPGLAISGTLTSLGTSIAVIALWFFTIINVFGVKWGGLYSVITTVGKLIPLMIFVFIGLGYLKTGNFTPFIPYGFTGITLAVTLFFWSYTGFEVLVVPTEEIKNPAKTIPLAMILTMVISIVVYLAIAMVWIGMIRWNSGKFTISSWHDVMNLSSPLSDVSNNLGLPWLAGFIVIGAIIATAGAGGIWVLIQGRMPFAMARDKLFWEPMAKVHPRFHTPANSLIFTSILTTIVLVAIPNFPSVALIASMTAVVPYAAAVLSVPILRAQRPQDARPFKLPAAKVFTMIGFVFSTFLIYWAQWPWTMVGGILILLGYPAFLLTKKRDNNPKRSLWVLVYLVGIMIVSLIGDPTFCYNNFTPIKPLGWLLMPYDTLVLALFSLAIYWWAYKENIAHKAVLPTGR